MEVPSTGPQESFDEELPEGRCNEEMKAVLEILGADFQSLERRS
jgi:hypothetical protein